MDAVSTSTGVAVAAAGDVDIVRLNFWVARERGRDENELRERNWRECNGVVAVVRWEVSRRGQRRRRSFDILGSFLRFCGVLHSHMVIVSRNNNPVTRLRQQRSCTS